MTMHPSLGGAKRQRHRNILKRHERLQYLLERDRWQETDSVFGLPKIKNIKMKIRKEKKEAAAAPDTVGAAAPTASGPTGAAKPAAPDKVGTKPEAKGKAESKGK